MPVAHSFSFQLLTTFKRMSLLLKKKTSPLTYHSNLAIKSLRFISCQSPTALLSQRLLFIGATC